VTTQALSWLAKNDTRDYPLVDGSALGVTAITDLHIAFPSTWDLSGSAVVYVDTAVVAPGIARLGVSLSGYINADGTARILWVEVINPIPGRVYTLSGSAEAYGFVCFGSSIRSSTPIEFTGTADTAEVLESVINRYTSSAYSGIEAQAVLLTGDVTVKGVSGIVCEVIPVYYDTGVGLPELVDSLVIRLEYDNDIMSAPVVRCERPTESGFFPDLATSMNGVRPTTDGTVYLQLDASYDFVYDDDGAVMYDTAGNPVQSTSPVLAMIAGPLGTMVFEDQFDYRHLCAEKSKSKTEQPRRQCEGCAPQDYTGGGYDHADGIPITYAGARIYGNRLQIMWAYFVQAAPQFGGDPLGITIRQEVGTASMFITGLISCVGSSPRLPGSLVPCQNEVSTSGLEGSPVVTTYSLSRVVAAGERFKLEGNADAIQSAGGTYRSPPFVSCELTAEAT